MRTDSQPVSEIVQQVVSMVPQGLSDTRRAQLSAFIGLYYERVQESDLRSSAIEDLYGAAAAHWHQLQEKPSQSPLIRLYNPTQTSHGWQSTHTVIEIVTDDVPHLIASLSMTLVNSKLGIHQIVHPSMSVSRDPAGQLLCIHSAVNTGSQVQDSDEDIRQESIIHIEIDRVARQSEFDEIRLALSQTIRALNTVESDLDAMRSFRDALPARCLKEADNARDLLTWINDRRFLLLGTAMLPASTRGDASGNLQNPLGILSESDIAVSVINAATVHHTDSLSLVKINHRSPVARPENLDVITAETKDGSACLVGLLAPGIKHLDTSEIPLLNAKTRDVLKASGLSTRSHAGKSLETTLEQFPPDMLIHNDPTRLLEIASGILNLQERQRIGLFGAAAPGGSYCNCLVYIPRERYGRKLRLEIENILLSELGGTSSEFDSSFSSESTLARIHYQIHRDTPTEQQPDWPQIEARVRQAAISWDDELYATLSNNYDEDRANQLFRQYRDAIPNSYKEDYSARIAFSDIRFIEDNLKDDQPVMSFYRNIMADAGTVNFKLFSPRQHIALSDVIPIIENMGLRVDAEHPFHIKTKHRADVWIHEFTAQHVDGRDVVTDEPGERIQTAFKHTWSGGVENDGFNRLILEGAVDWRQVVIIRSYSKYLLQIRVPYSQAYMVDSLVSNASITKLLIKLFEHRFDPDLSGDREALQAQTRADIVAALADVQSLDQDRILRNFLNLIDATVRTNFYCQQLVNGAATQYDYVSFKFDSAHIKSLPLPRPAYEIFVYSPRVEGIHLRGGKVARGGLRWSDRREDFRTEVLGLMKAQMVKNAVIVPVGSKGGFYVKRPPVGGDRDELQQEGIACYRIFLRGLLDITDNFNEDTVVPPARVVRYDDDDPYLVVAADKGTATFSDYANAISEEYGFWLGDAFASGGSVGYDHKKMGITARGAWESVKRHFRQLDINTQTTPFTVVGIGDMAGDVFGNGMLLSEHILLKAAFNHLHIFIDPNPDAATSFAERDRLFNLPRSSWTDYDSSLISAGGGLYPRSAKSISLSPEAVKSLGLPEATMTPNELIHHLLLAPVDLLWNGGIGTYVKAHTESHSDARDRANDAVRVDARQLRCKVVGEGGNLGLTQQARIEFAQHGGLIYTDAIDNSAGVDCSDHEVNIKVLLNTIVQNGDMTGKQRDLLLADMTDDVADLVLMDNYLQTQCITTAAAEATAMLAEHARFINRLESAGKLDRIIEHLPDNEEIAERLANEKGLTRPELAVIVAYSKMTLYDALLNSSFPDDPWLERVLLDYFPDRIQAEHADAVTQHRLRREIIATIVTNQLVNRLGPTFLHRMQEELGATESAIATAFVAVCEIFSMSGLWADIEALDNQIPADIQTSMQTLVRGLVERAMHWHLRSRRPAAGIQTLVDDFKEGAEALIDSLPDSLASIHRKTLDERCAYFSDAGAPQSTAMAVARVVPLSSALDIIEISKSQEKPVSLVATVYYELGVLLNLQWLRDEIGGLAVSTHWHTLAKSELRSDLHYQQRHLCAEILSKGRTTEDSDAMVTKWFASNKTTVAKYNELISDMKASTSVDFAMLSLAVNEVHKLLRTDRPLAS